MNAQQLFALSNQAAASITDETVEATFIELKAINSTLEITEIKLDCGRRQITYTVVLNGEQYSNTEGFGGLIRRVLANKTPSQERAEKNAAIAHSEQLQQQAKADAKAEQASQPVAFDHANFAAWKAEADMPEQHAEGGWYDLETGLSYNPKWDYRNDKPMRGFAFEFKTAKAKISEKGQKARDEVKVLGAKALVGGTVKQKQWAEQIRKEKMNNAGSSLPALLASNAAKKTEFWIDVRFLYVDKIVRVAEVLDNKEELRYQHIRGTVIPTKANQVIRMLKMDEKQ
jgi:hypothetical protein